MSTPRRKRLPVSDEEEAEREEREEFREWKKERRQRRIESRLYELERMADNNELSTPKWALRVLMDELEWEDVGPDTEIALVIVENVLANRKPYSFGEDEDEEAEKERLRR